MHVEHVPRAIGKFRCLVFPKSAKLENWHRDPSSGLLLPNVPPEFDSGWVSNLVVNVGKALTQNQVFGLTATPVNTTGVGSSAAAEPPAVISPAATDTFLTTPVYQVFDAPPLLAGAVITCQSTFPGGSTAFQWKEAGMFNGAGTTMLDRVTGFGDPTPGGAAAVAAWTYTQL